MSLPLAFSLDSLVQTFSTGGWFMIPLALCSMVALTIVLLRSFALRRESVLPKLIEDEIERLPPGANPESLRQLVRDDPAALSCLTRVALDHLRVPRGDNTEAVQARARREIMRLEAGLPALELIVGISPLLGLLGAVSGLVRVLSNFGGAGGASSDASGIAQGIAEVLYTTIFGLAIAIPTLVAYTIFARRVEGMAVQMESLMAELLSKCYYQRPARPPAPPARPPESAAYADDLGADDYEPISAAATYVPQARRAAAPAMPAPPPAEPA